MNRRTYGRFAPLPYQKLLGCFLSPASAHHCSNTGFLSNSTTRSEHFSTVSTLQGFGTRCFSAPNHAKKKNFFVIHFLTQSTPRAGSCRKLRLPPRGCAPCLFRSIRSSSKPNRQFSLKRSTQEYLSFVFNPLHWIPTLLTASTF